MFCGPLGLGACVLQFWKNETPLSGSLGFLEVKSGSENLLGCFEKAQGPGVVSGTLQEDPRA